jgi:hypothetical protein
MLGADGFGILIGSIGGHCIETVNGTNDFCPQRDFTGRQPSGIAGTIDTFMVAVYIFLDCAWKMKLL